MRRLLARREVVCLGVLVLFGCSQVQDLVSTDPRDFLTLTAQTTRLPADGASSTVITAHVSPAAGSDMREVTFVTSNGSFDSDPFDPLREVVVLADVNGDARVELYATSTIASATVSANVAEIARTLAFEFVRAYPDNIAIEVDRSDLCLDCCSGLLSESVELRVVLGRSIGMVTPGLRLDFSATRASDGRAVGTFQNQTLSDDSGELSARLHVTSQDCPARDPLTCTDEVPCHVTIIGRATNNETGAVIEGRASVLVEP